MYIEKVVFLYCASERVLCVCVCVCDVCVYMPGLLACSGGWRGSFGAVFLKKIKSILFFLILVLLGRLSGRLFGRFFLQFLQ